MQLRRSYKQLRNVVWCHCCSKDAPAGKNRAVEMAPFRKLPYQLKEDGFTIDDRLIGVCEKCKETVLNDFQRKNTISYVDYGDKRLVRVAI